MTINRTGRRLGWIGVLTALLALSGCGPAQRGGVEGRVLLPGGQPAPTGRVTFVGADGQIASSEIVNGDYHIIDVAPGEAKIVVVTKIRAPIGLGGSGDAAPESIPEKYTKPDESPLRYRVAPGPQKHDIELAP